MGKTTCLQCRGHGFHSCSGNQDPTRPHGVEMAVVTVGSPPPLLHPSPLDQVSGQGSLRPMATKMLPGWLLWLVSLALATWLPKCVSGRVGGGVSDSWGTERLPGLGCLLGWVPFYWVLTPLSRYLLYGAGSGRPGRAERKESTSPGSSLLAMLGLPVVGLLSRVGRDCVSLGCPDYEVGGGRH